MLRNGMHHENVGNRAYDRRDGKTRIAGSYLTVFGAFDKQRSQPLKRIGKKMVGYPATVIVADVELPENNTPQIFVRLMEPYQFVYIYTYFVPHRDILTENISFPN